MAERQVSRTARAFDFGTRRIGVAVGTEMLGTATPLVPLHVRDGIPDWNVVNRLIEEWQPDLFVVGLPLELDGSETLMCSRARKFGKRLYGRYGKPLEMWDERGSTKAAKGLARERGHRGNYRDDGVDGLAAQLILESWFASQRGEGDLVGS